MSLLADDDDWAELEADGIAAEYALGLLTKQEAAAAEEVMALDPETARAVAVWTVTFSGFSNAGLPRTPPPEVCARICGAASEAPDFSDAPGGALHRWMRRLVWRQRTGGRSVWRTAALGLAVVAAIAAAVWVGSTRTGPDYHGVIPGTATVPGLAVHLAASTREVTVNPYGDGVSLMPPFGKTFALWVIADGPPVYIGAVDVLGHLTALLPPGIAAGQVSVMVTLESRAAQSPDAPSRAVVARAALTPAS